MPNQFVIGRRTFFRLWPATISTGNSSASCSGCAPALKAYTPRKQGATFRRDTQMKNRLRGAIFASAKAALITALWLGVMPIVGQGPGLQGTTYCGRQTGLKRDLGGSEHSKLGYPGSCGASGTCGCPRRGFQRSRRTRRSGRQRDTLSTGGSGEKAGEL